MVNLSLSLTYLLIVLGTIVCYVSIGLLFVYMFYYVICNDWKNLRWKGYGWCWRGGIIVGKQFLIIAGIAVTIYTIFQIDYSTRDVWKNYDHFRFSNHAILYIFSFKVIYFFSLVINTIIIDRNNKKEQSTDFKSFSKYLAAKSIFRNIITICALAVITGYGVQYFKWNGKNNAHLNAKKYWAAGQVLNGFRITLSQYFHHEHLIFYPLHYLQEVLYSKGVAFIPTDDGEIGVWKNVWFLSHYTRNGREPLFIYRSRPSKKKTTILDQQWYCLEMMATNPIKDKEMEEEYYLNDYPSLALAYNLGEGWYSGKVRSSARDMAKLGEHVERSEKLVSWLKNFEQKMDDNSFFPSSSKISMKSKIMTHATIILELEDVIHGSIFNKKFDCTSSTIADYLKYKFELIGISSLQNIDETNDLVNVSLHNNRAKAISFMLNRYCSIDFESFSNENDRHMSKNTQVISKPVTTFSEELIILEEIFNGR